MSEPYYAYIFVRQDISKEQQLVQAAHATCKLGQRMDKNINADYLHFVVIGVEDLKALDKVSDYLVQFGFDHVWFREGHFNDEMTAIAVKPVRGAFPRSFFKDFKTLKFAA